MAGNSKRKGATRRAGSKKGAQVGTGGHGRKALEGKGPTPKAEDRPYHAAHKRKKSSDAAAARPQKVSRAVQEISRGAEVVVGRNAVLEALRADVRAERLYVFTKIDADDRIAESVERALELEIPIAEVPRSDLDALAGDQVHQGIALAIAPYAYAHLDDVRGGDGPALIVALDSIQDPRNLGAIARSAAAFGATGMLLPERRAAGVTAATWRTSAGAVSRLPIARVTNLARSIDALKAERVFVVGLAGDGDVPITDCDLLDEDCMIVVGSEGKGLSRLVREQCDVVASIPIDAATESLNASVAASVALYEARRRRG